MNFNSVNNQSDMKCLESYYERINNSTSFFSETSSDYDFSGVSDPNDKTISIHGESDIEPRKPKKIRVQEMLQL